MNLEIKNTTYKQLLWIGMASITLFFCRIDLRLLLLDHQKVGGEDNYAKVFLV